MDVVDDALGEAAEIGLAQLEVDTVHCRKDHVTVDAVLDQPAQRRFDEFEDSALVLGLGALETNGEQRLGAVVVEAAADDFAAEPRIDERLPERRRGGAEQQVAQDAVPQAMLAVGGSAHLPADQHIRLLLQGFAGGHRVAERPVPELLEAALELDGGIDILPPEFLQVVLLHEFEALAGVVIAVEKDAAVAGVVVFAVKLAELLIRQVRYRLRVAAGFAAVGGARKQQVREVPVDQALGIGEHALHLVVHHPLVGERRVVPQADQGERQP